MQTYEELPPIFKLEKTRWGDEWDEINYQTNKPLLEHSHKHEFPLFFSEAGYYTWICYIVLKDEIVPE